ncbi:hypothetical protein L1049_022534 [Liquidambar formosana]|uniref:Uncharacterized protein n=1 Tax=Liquidambar formosana TaxID=63359 RepID=A0AAP0WNW9_LIQFO
MGEVGRQKCDSPTVEAEYGWDLTRRRRRPPELTTLPCFACVAHPHCSISPILRRIFHRRVSYRRRRFRWLHLGTLVVFRRRRRLRPMSQGAKCRCHGCRR